MATIKAYTDLEQSKKLAEILPFESADMCWTKYIDNGDITSLHATVNYGIVIIDYPCWSLASLLSVLPFPVLYMEMVAGVIFWCCECHFIETDETFKLEHYDNPIDACVAMVKKLYELKML